MKKFLAQFRIYVLVLAVAMFLTGAESLAGESAKANPSEIQKFRSKADELPGAEISPLVWVALGVAAVGVIAAIVISNNNSEDDSPQSVTPDSSSETESQNEQESSELFGELQSSTHGPSLSLFEETNSLKGVPAYRACLRSVR